MTEPRDARLLVVAIGGDAWRETRRVAKPDDWFRALGRTLPPLVELVAAGFRLVLTHGNRSQVGDAMLRMELARRSLPPLSLDLCGAETQGSLGYAIQQVFGNLCRARGLEVPVATVVTRVVVDPQDPAFARPTAPVGPVYPPAKAKRLAREKGWAVARDGRRGFRRLLPSPRPLRVLEAELVGRLSLAGAVAIACGGGGVAVVETPAGYRGVEALIEPDLATETLATGLGAERLLLVTAVERVVVSHGTAREIGIERLTLAEARMLLTAGEFPPGSMGPKVEAAARFVEQGRGRAAIGDLDSAVAVLAEKSGTTIVSG
ncbi:MAG TPA: carbamate kinase [Methylomirabilota bacterium]|nr:carbamate kinase [Methylomirabilota bacterium]